LRYRRTVLIALGGSLLATVATAAIPLVQRQIIDDVIVSRQASIWPLAGLLVVAAAINFWGIYLRRYRGGQLSLDVQHDMRTDLFDALSEIGLADAGAETIADATTCPGSDTCRLGIASAKGLGAQFSDALEGELASFGEVARDVKIKISGCPNGCAQHSIADIGFHAAALSEGDRTVPAYLLFIGGRAALDEAALGSAIGKYPARNGVEVLRRLLTLYRDDRRPAESFHSYVSRLGEEAIREALDPLRAVPSHEEDPSFYQDFGHENERFAVRQGIKGECAGSTVAEAVPAIEDARSWQAQAEAYFEHREYAHAQLAAYRAAADAARVPLYRRLVDPFTPEQALWEFENIFVLAGETAGDWTDLSARFERLRAAEPSEIAARTILAEARAFVEYCEVGFETAPVLAAAAARG